MRRRKFLVRRGRRFNGRLIRELSEASGINTKSLEDNIVELAEVTGLTSVLEEYHE